MEFRRMKEFGIKEDVQLSKFSRFVAKNEKKKKKKRKPENQQPKLKFTMYTSKKKKNH